MRIRFMPKILAAALSHDITRQHAIDCESQVIWLMAEVAMPRESDPSGAAQELSEKGFSNHGERRKPANKTPLRDEDESKWGIPNRGRMLAKSGNCGSNFQNKSVAGNVP